MMQYNIGMHGRQHMVKTLRRSIYVLGMLISRGETHLPDTSRMFRPELKFTLN